MAFELRIPTRTELPAATELCPRSKAHWGYDQSFMEACFQELMLTSDDLENDQVVVAISNDVMVGVVQVSVVERGCFLEKLFVDPDRMGEGIGRAMYDWSIETTRKLGASELVIEADPNAEPFYLRMGGIRAGFANSGSIPGRQLPLLVHRLQSNSPILCPETEHAAAKTTQ